MIVIAKHSLKGNCVLLNGTDVNSSSEHSNGIRGIKTDFPWNDPDAISAWITLLLNCLHINQVPFDKPSVGFIFLIRITGQFLFSFSSCGGIPFGVNEFRKS